MCLRLRIVANEKQRREIEYPAIVVPIKIGEIIAALANVIYIPVDAKAGIGRFDPKIAQSAEQGGLRGQRVGTDEIGSSLRQLHMVVVLKAHVALPAEEVGIQRLQFDFQQIHEDASSLIKCRKRTIPCT